jgi:hypothetical protein
MPAPVTLAVTKSILTNSINNLVTTDISGIYTSVTTTQPTHGTVSITFDRHVFYTPTAGYLGADSFTYRAIGPGGTSSPSTVTISVGIETNVPVTSNTNQSIISNSVNNIIDISVINLPTRLAIVNNPEYGIATVIGQGIVYTPDNGYYGVDSFDYTASNRFGTSNTGTVTLTVAPVLPVTTNSNQTIIFNSIDTLIDLNVNGIYSNIYISNTTTHGILEVGTSTIYYTPNNQYQGTDSFRYYVSNITGISNTSTVSLTVAIPNIIALPAAGALPRGVINTPYSPITLTASGGTAPYTNVIISGSLPPGLTLTSGVIQGTPTQVGAYTFTVSFTDSHSPEHFTVYNTYILTVYSTANTVNFEWFTPPGILFTATQGVFTSTVVNASNVTATYTIIAGNLPQGISLQSSGYLAGTTSATPKLYTFVVRASVDPVISDNTFSINVISTSTPVWSYDPGPYDFGILNERQYIDIQLLATDGQNEITYKLISNYASFPNSLKLSSSGLISGILNTSATIGAPNSYSFDVEAFNGIRTSTQTFTMVVVDPYNSVNSFIPPQFINPSFLGYFSDQTTQYIPVTAFDPYPSLGTVTYSSTGTLPLGLSLNSNIGFLYGYIAAQPNYLKEYSFEITATKINSNTFARADVVNTFTMTVIQQGSDVVSWITPQNLGTIVKGMPSMLKVEGTQTSNAIPLQYGLDLGSLPPGLTVNPNGDISGIPRSTGTFVSTIIASPAPYGIGSVTSTDTTYAYPLSLRDFTITVIDTTVPYTNIYLKPLLSKEKRAIYSNFISNTDIFVPSLLFRNTDSNFGTQPNLQMYLEYGIQELNSSTDYVSILYENFNNSTYYFGDVKSLTAVDDLGNPVYDVVYVEIIDPLANIAPTVTSNGDTYYPSSIKNMKMQLASLNDISINSEFSPLFVQTAQQLNLGFLNLVVLCYTLPGKGSKIVNRIQNNNFDFKQFNFTVDRFTIEKTLVSNDSAYLVFPKTTI